MKHNSYIISDAAKKVHVESHVLRYWEEELGLDIPRNDMGHRQYTEENIQLFLNIHNLKEHGFLLKAIKILLPELYGKTESELSAYYLLKDELNARGEELIVENDSLPLNCSSTQDNKLIMFKEILGEVFTSVLEKESPQMLSNMSKKISDDVSEDVSCLLHNHMEREEAHFRELDAAIRAQQRAVKETAVTSIGKRRGLHFRNK